MSENTYQDGTSATTISEEIEIDTTPFQRFAEGEYDELSEGEGINVGVDVEGVVADIIPPFAVSTDNFFQQNHSDYHQDQLEGEFTVEDAGGWGQVGTMEHLAEARVWEEYGVTDVLFGEDKEYTENNPGEWKGFMYTVDKHWNNEWPYADKEAEDDIIDPVEGSSPEAIAQIKESPIVDNVYFVTGRNDDLDEETEGVEDSVRDWLDRHGYLEEADGLFHTVSKTQLTVDGEPVHVFPDDNPEMMAEKRRDEVVSGQTQVLINYEGNFMGENPLDHACEEYNAMSEYIAGFEENIEDFAEAVHDPDYQRSLIQALTP